MNDKILTLNPDPDKKGVRIDKEKYDFIRQELLGVLGEKGPLSAMQLVNQAKTRIGPKKFGGSVGWYATAVRLDLEARGEIKYNRGDKKPVISLP